MYKILYLPSAEFLKIRKEASEPLCGDPIDSYNSFNRKGLDVPDAVMEDFDKTLNLKLSLTTIPTDHKVAEFATAKAANFYLDKLIDNVKNDLFFNKVRKEYFEIIEI